MKIYKLITKPNTKFRIGGTGWNDSDFMIHSDTLFSGIINCCNLLYGQNKVKNLIKAYETGHIKHSSVFLLIDIYKNNNYEKTIRFFPKPVGIIQALRRQDRNSTSEIISAKWVSEEIFMKISKQFNEDYKKYELEKDNEKLFSFDLKKDNYIADSNFIYTKNEIDSKIEKPFLQTIITAKNSTGRQIEQNSSDENNGVQLFREISIQLNEVKQNNFTIKPHFYFLANLNKKLDLKNEFEASLRLLADEGLGGKRTYGYGQFEKINTDNFKQTNNFKWSENRINLSLTNPVIFNNEQDEIIFYNSILRSGWLKQHKKKSVRMITEGSFFKNRIAGRLVDVSQSTERAVQNGIAFFGT